MTITVSEEEGRQLAAILLILRRKATRGPFWANFLPTIESALRQMGRP